MGTREWWWYVLGGLAAFVAGLFFVFSPSSSLRTMVTVFAVYVIVMGLSLLLAGLRSKAEGAARRAQLIEAGLAIAVGLVLLVVPGITLFALSWIVGVWAVVVGGTEFVHGFAERKVAASSSLVVAAGALTTIFGLALIFSRAASEVALGWLLGFYLVAWGSVRVAYGASLNAPAARQPA